MISILKFTFIEFNKSFYSFYSFILSIHSILLLFIYSESIDYIPIMGYKICVLTWEKFIV